MTAREEIVACDRAIVEALNRRVELAATWADVPALVEANDGPVSEAALRELFAVVVALTKREAARAALGWHPTANRATL